ncbi:MAG: hypothetical protein ACI4SQ_02310 [Eubacterium sp.]
MISKRRFLILIMMMFVLLFMFQFTQVVKEHGNTYNTNQYLQKKEIVHVSHPDSDEKLAVFIGQKEEKCGKIAAKWCEYTKRKFVALDSLHECKEHLAKKSDIILVEKDALTSDADLDKVLAYTKLGVSFVFCNLPDTATIAMSSRWRKVLGIKQIKQEKVELTGVNLFDGFLIGGQAIYQPTDAKEKEERQDLSEKIPWYLLESGCKAYMVGMLSDKSVKNEDLPAIVWRASVGEAKVFAVNGDYMEDCTGIGFLDAMMAELHRYEIYPVVNAQNMSVANFSAFASENKEAMKKLYSRESIAVFRDIIWPGLCANQEQSGAKLTCFFSPQMEYSDENLPDAKQLIFYLKELQEKSAEAGISLDNFRYVDSADKLRKDSFFMKQAQSKYPYGAAYVTKWQKEDYEKVLSQSYFSSVTTIVGDFLEDTVVGKENDRTTVQSITSNGISHTYRQDIRMKSLQTSLAYSNLVFDLKDILWPQKKEDRWEILFEKFSSNTNTFWKAFDGFEKTTVSQADARIRNFLAVNYRDSLEKDTIRLSISGQYEGETAWFMLRTHGEEVEPLSGASVKKIEEGAYLVGAQKKEVCLHLKNQNEIYYSLSE